MSMRKHRGREKGEGRASGKKGDVFVLFISLGGKMREIPQTKTLQGRER